MIFTKSFSILCIFPLLLFTNLFAEIDRTYPLADEDYWEKIETLNFSSANPAVLRSQQATITHNGELIFLNNEDSIRQYDFWSFGLDDGLKDFYSFYYPDPSNNDVGIQFYGLLFNDDGYIKIDDWDQVKPDDLLNEKKENAKINNEIRKERGLETVEDVVWVEKPTLDKEYNMISYSFKVVWGNQTNINTFVLMLGKSGYTEFEILASYENEDEFKASKQLIRHLKQNFKYNPELEYKDYKPGDKVAAYGIAALVATSLGVKGLAKAGVLMLALKKFWFILLFPFIFLFRLISGKSNKK